MSTAMAPDWTEGEPGIRLYHCADCGQAFYFHRNFCVSCLSSSIEATPASGRGTIAAVTLVVRAPSPDLAALAPYTIVLADLDEGIRIMAHGACGLKIGDRALASFRCFGDRPNIPIFEVEGQAG